MITCHVALAGSTLEVKIVGDADVANVRALYELLGGVPLSGGAVVVDLDGVERLDGAGVQLLLAFKSYVERSGASMSVVARTDAATRALALSGANEILCR